MPSSFGRSTVALRVAALAVVALAVAALTVTALAVTTPAVGTAASAPANAADAALDEVDRNASANVTIRSGTAVEWSELDDDEAIQAAIDDGTLSRAGTVAVGDPLVVEIRHAGLADHLAAGDATRRFFSAFGTRTANLTFEQTNPGANQLPARIRFSPNATTVVADAADGTTYVVIATTRAPVVRDRDDDPEFERVDYYDGDTFYANLELSAESNLTADGRVTAASDEFRVRNRTARIAVDDPVSRVVYANPAPNRTIRGETNVRPGLNVTVIVRGRDDPETAVNESFVRAETVTVRDGGPDESPTFAATLDFEGVGQNATATVDVRHDGRSILGTNATVAVVEPTADLAVREVEPNATGPYARVRADADLSRGGFVVLHHGSADGPVVGASRFLERGAHENVTVYVGDRVEESGRLVAVAHRDANYNRWFDDAQLDPAYADGGTVAVETDLVLRPRTTRRATRTTTPTLTLTTRTSTPTMTRPETGGTETGGAATATTTDAPMRRSGSTPTTHSTPGPDSPPGVPIPGFGVGAAVAALLAVGVRAAQRR